MDGKRKAAVAVIILGAAGCLCLLAYRGMALSGNARDAWAETYMAAIANYGVDYDKLPSDIEAYQEWNVQGPYLPNMQDKSILPENALADLAGTYRMLCQIRLKDPENETCRALFEELVPYFETAFCWEPGTDTAQCLKRLAKLSEPEALEEMGRLGEEVQKLYESTEAETIWHPVWFGTVSSGGNLQMEP